MNRWTKHVPPAIVAVALLLASWHLLGSFPRIHDYSSADETTYYLQASRVQLHGLDGFRELADEHMHDRSSHPFPNPLRILPIGLNALALSISDSFATLSFLSLGAFALLCLLSYRAISATWSPELAVVAVALLCFSPLENAMARRALIDSLSCLAVAFSLFRFLALIESATTQRLATFGASLVLVQLVKETGMLVYPFYFSALLYLKLRGRLAIRLRDLLLSFAVPLLIVLAVYQAVYGLAPTFAIYQAIYHDNVLATFDYVKDYNAGPWYSYFVDFLILSPLTFLLAVMYSGHYVLKREYDVRTSAILIFSVYLLAVHALLSKNVRYLMILDPVLRILAALAVTTGVSSWIGERARRPVAIALITLLLIGVDVATFRRHFVVGNTYDPVSYNLLCTERFVPTARPPKLPGGATAAPENRPIALTLLYKSFSYHQAGRFAESIELAEQALRAWPDFADAYNNLCAGYNALKEWDKAIAAGEKALALDPENTLAKGNLAWARSQKTAAGKSP